MADLWISQIAVLGNLLQIWRRVSDTSTSWLATVYNFREIKQMSKVILQEAASPSCHYLLRQTHSSAVCSERLCNALVCRYVTNSRHYVPFKVPLLWDLKSSSNTWCFHEPTSFGISIGSAVFPQISRVSITHRQTDRHTNTQTTLRVTSVTIDPIYALLVGDNA